MPKSPESQKPSEASRRHSLMPKVIREGSKFGFVDEGLQKRAEWMREVSKIREYMEPKIVWRDPKQKMLGAKEGVSVLCVGAGKGHEMDELDQVLPHSRIVGCDPHDHYTKPVKKRLETLAHDARYLPEDVTATDLKGVEDESMDAATLYFVMHHMDAKEHEAAFSELRRVLKPDGYVFVAEDIVDSEQERKVTEQIDRKLNFELQKDLPHNYRNIPSWTEFFRSMGFDTVEANEVKPGEVRHGFFVLKRMEEKES